MFKTILTGLMLVCSSLYCAKQPSVQQMYIDLVKKCVCGTLYQDYPAYDRWQRPAPGILSKEELAHRQTLIDEFALGHLQDFMEDILENNVQGHFIETGVWRGGATIFMRAFLKARNDKNRIVWVADSFAGVPPPNSALYPLDHGIDLFQIDWLAVPLEEVKAHFARYGLLDSQVRFLKGWFKDTLPTAPIDKIALMRLDGDLYESTMDALTALYPKLSKGGYVIIDDYGAIPACAQAVHDYRAMHGITEPIIPLDWTEAYWKKVD